MNPQFWHLVNSQLPRFPRLVNSPFFIAHAIYGTSDNLVNWGRLLAKFYEAAGALHKTPKHGLVKPLMWSNMKHHILSKSYVSSAKAFPHWMKGPQSHFQIGWNEHQSQTKQPHSHNLIKPDTLWSPIQSPLGLGFTSHGKSNVVLRSSGGSVCICWLTWLPRRHMHFQLRVLVHFFLASKEPMFFVDCIFRSVTGVGSHSGAPNEIKGWTTTRAESKGERSKASNPKRIYLWCCVCCPIGGVFPGIWGDNWKNH